jgi:outer membrane protein
MRAWLNDEIVRTFKKIRHMTRTISSLLFGVFLLCSGVRVSAQSKFACISFNELMSSMPEAKKADTTLIEYRAALEQQFETMKTEYTAQATVLTSKDTAKLTKPQLELKRRSLAELLGKIQSFEQEASQLLDQKRSDLFVPIQRKAEDAIAQVARDNSYAYVFEKDNLHFYPPGDDILPLVRKKLGLPVAKG